MEFNKSNKMNHCFSQIVYSKAEALKEARRLVKLCKKAPVKVKITIGEQIDGLIREYGLSYQEIFRRT